MTQAPRGALEVADLLGRPAPPADTAPEAIEALAFATDAQSEQALREGISFLSNAQVWPGGLRAAAGSLGQGHAAALVFVDLDGETYPAGALYELAAVCEEGTAVVAFGEGGTAGYCREVLLAGVAEYLVKPLTAAAVREAAVRAADASAGRPPRGTLAGFTGTGGTGATTMAALAALGAASRGRYVSVLDLDRTYPALSLMLDAEPASGLGDLLGASSRASLHPEMVERVGTPRSARLTVYGYTPSAAPPPAPAPAWAVCELLVELQRRSHLVIVDGVDDPALNAAVLALADTRVLVVEPTTTGAAAAARTVARLGPLLGAGRPTVLVSNHTRAFPPKAGARALVRAGFRARPSVNIPFEPALPAHVDWGMPEEKLPRALRAPIAGLVDRVLAPAAPEAERAEALDRSPDPARGRARPTRASRARASAAAARPRRPGLRAALRGLLGPGTEGLRPARGA